MANKIDAHMHISQWYTPDGKVSFDVLGDYYNKMKIDNVDIMSCTNNADLWTGYEADQSIIAAIAKNEYPQTFIHGCMLLPSMVKEGTIPEAFDFKYQLQMLMSMGFDGIKFCEFKPDSFKVNDMAKRLDDFEAYFTYCEEKDIPMCWHIADPETFWDADKVPDFAKENGWFYGNGTFPTYQELYRLTYGILDRHPKLRVMLAHAFFLSDYPEQMTALLDKYPNVTIDMAPGWEMFSGFKNHYDEWYHIFRKYSDRFLFATDADMTYGYPEASNLAKNVLRYLETADEFVTPGNHLTKGIVLEEKDLEKILSGNCHTILGNAPKELDRAVFKEYCKTFMPYIPDSVNKTEIEKYLKKL